MIWLANAPVSYGVYGWDPHAPGPQGSGDEILTMVSEAGYAGIDLGPPGLLGDSTTLNGNLASHGLGLAGGWVELPLASGSDEEFETALDAAVATIDLMAVVATAGVGPAPKPTLADAGDARRRAAPGGARELELDDAGWRRLASRLDVAARIVRDRGLEPTFHHHACTYVETVREIDRFLEVSDVDLTFDTGHLLVGGGQPVTDLGRWLSRINHVHLKDADLEVLAAARQSKDPMAEIWQNRVFCPLGSGDLDLDAMVGNLLDSGYEGWLVVEQDVVVSTQDEVRRADAEQRANREHLRRWFT